MKRFFIFAMSVFAMAALSTSCGGGSNSGKETADTVSVVADTVQSDSVSSDKSDSLIRCHAVTKKGTQCERLCKYPDTLCFQHKQK